MITLLDTLLNGLSLGSTYAIIALGYTMVYGIAKMLNFAHGDVIMIGGYLSYSAIFYWGWPPLLGFALALLSGVTYAAYIVSLGKEAKRPLPLFRLMLVVPISGVFLCGATGLAMGKLVFSMPPMAWICAIAVALLAAVVGSVLFQKGVREIGGANSALLSLFEPITSVIFSVLLLGDSFSPLKILGSVLILGGLALISFYDAKKA